MDVLTTMNDVEGARVAARALEQNCAQEARAWLRLERYYRDIGDRRREVQAGERYLRLGGDPEARDG